MSPETLPFAYGVNEFTTMPWTFEEDVENHARLGVEALELCEVKLDDDRTEEQLALVAAAGLPICSVQPSVRAVFPSAGQPEPTDRRERLAHFRRTIERIAPHAPGAAFITNTGPAPGGDMAGAVEQVIYHRELAEIAAGHEVRVALEPLNPVSLNLETAIWTYGQALRILQEVDRENVGICLDLWNLWQDAGLVPLFWEVEPGIPDGFCVDVRDPSTTSSDEGVQVFSAGGEPLAEIPTPQTCANCAFGGTGGTRLFVAAGEYLYAVDLPG